MKDVWPALLVGVLTAVVSFSLGAAWSAFAERRRGRAALTIEVYRAFNEPQTLAKRNRIWVLLGGRAERSEALDVRTLADHLDERDWLDLSELLHTFDSIATLVSTRHLSPRTVDDLFGRYIRVWKPYLTPVLRPAEQAGSGPWHALAANVLSLQERFSA